MQATLVQFSMLNSILNLIYVFVSSLRYTVQLAPQDGLKRISDTGVRSQAACKYERNQDRRHERNAIKCMMPQ